MNPKNHRVRIASEKQNNNNLTAKIDQAIEESSNS
jgi:hypothetical protein